MVDINGIKKTGVYQFATTPDGPMFKTHPDAEWIDSVSLINLKQEHIAQLESRNTELERIKLEWEQVVKPADDYVDQKPVRLCEFLIETYTKEGDTVLDFCMGSGTTGVACVNTKRNFIGIEKISKYFDAALKRIRASENDNQSFSVTG